VAIGRRATDREESAVEREIDGRRSGVRKAVARSVCGTEANYAIRVRCSWVRIDQSPILVRGFQ
jgi:hypothetical protein